MAEWCAVKWEEEAGREGGMHISRWKGALADIRKAKGNLGDLFEHRWNMTSVVDGYDCPIPSRNWWIQLGMACRLRFGRQG